MSSLVLKLHLGGKPYVGCLWPDFGQAVAKAINAARLHGSSQLFTTSEEVGDFEQDPAKTKSAIEAMALHDGEFEVILRAVGLVVRIDIIHHPKDPPADESKSETLAEILERAEIQAMKAALKKHAGNRTVAARELAIDPRRLFKLLDEGKLMPEYPPPALLYHPSQTIRSHSAARLGGWFAFRLGRRPF